MANSNNDVRELEDLLTELEGQGALPAGPYSDEDDAVTQLMDTPLGEQEWMVQITPLDRRMMSTEQLLGELATGTLVKRDMLVWRNGMSDWSPIHRVEELAGSGVIDVPVTPERRPLPPPPAPIPPRIAALGVGAVGSSTLASPGALSLPAALSPPVALPPPPSLASTRVPAPSTPFGAPRPLTPVPDVPPPAPLPFLNSAFGSSGASPVPSVPPVSARPASTLPELGSAFNVPPPAAAPQPPPASASMRTNTQRPVAVDFSEIEPVRPAPIRVLIGSGVAALAMIVGTVYALSAGGVFSSPETSHVQPEPVAAASAAAAKPADEKPAADKPAAEKSAAGEPSRGSDEPQTQPVSAKEELVAPEPATRGAAKEEANDEAPKEKEAAKSKAAASDDEQEEASGPAKTRAERRLAARRQKREKTDEERVAAPRRSKLRATPAATAPRAPAAEADDAPKATTSDPPGSTFNRQAAKTALDDAAAQARNCRPQGGPSGSGKVQVRYEPNGKVGAVSLLTPQFENTTTGSCVVMVFRRASIPAFVGSPPVVMNKNFEIP